MTRLAALTVALCCLGVGAVAAHWGQRSVPSATAPEWRATDWTPAIDNWGPGLAFACDNAACPGTVRLFARTKVGFCNCFNGVADDDEIDRIGDVDLHTDAYTPLAPGTITAIGDLNGRKRLFTAPARWSTPRQVLSIVVASDCKAVVATVVAGTVITPAQEAAAVETLRGAAFQQWLAAR